MADRDMLSQADKDLICEFLYLSKGRVLDKELAYWNSPVPQGVSVFRAHPDKGTFEYMFTKRDKYPVELDDADTVRRALYLQAKNARGLVLYMNSCMVKVASKCKFVRWG